MLIDNPEILKKALDEAKQILETPVDNIGAIAQMHGIPVIESEFIRVPTLLVPVKRKLKKPKM